MDRAANRQIKLVCNLSNPLQNLERTIIFGGQLVKVDGPKRKLPIRLEFEVNPITN